MIDDYVIQCDNIPFVLSPFQLRCLARRCATCVFPLAGRPTSATRRGENCVAPPILDPTENQNELIQNLKTIFVTVIVKTCEISFIKYLETK